MILTEPEFKLYYKMSKDNEIHIHHCKRIAPFGMCRTSSEYVIRCDILCYSISFAMFEAFDHKQIANRC